MARPVDPRTRIDLLRAAETEFVAHGLERATVDGITRRAGCAKGSFYNHFASKADAFRQIVETMLARLEACVDEHAEDGPAPDADGWLAKDLEVFEYLWSNRGVARLLLEGGGSTEFRWFIDAFAERSRAGAERGIRRGIASGLYRSDVDPLVASLIVSGAYDRLARQLVRLDKKPDLTAWLRAVHGIFVRGIAGPAFAAMSDPPVIHGHAVAARRTRRAPPRKESR